MVASAVFVMDAKGKIIISRNFRGDVPMGVSERFSLHIQEREELEQQPVFTEGGYTYVYIRYNNLLLMSVTKRNSNVALMLVYLYKLAEVFRDYFGELEEVSTKIHKLYDFRLCNRIAIVCGERTAYSYQLQ
jgi:AP-1 complex subunit mu